MDYATVATLAIRSCGYESRIYYNKYKHSRSCKIYVRTPEQAKKYADAIEQAMKSAGFTNFKTKVREWSRSRAGWCPKSFIVSYPLRNK